MPKSILEEAYQTIPDFKLYIDRLMKCRNWTLDYALDSTLAREVYVYYTGNTLYTDGKENTIMEE